MTDSCVFCREMEGSRKTNFAILYPEFENRYLYKSDLLVAFPCIGQLTEGHFLIATKSHFNTFRRALSSSERLPQEVNKVLVKVHEMLNMNIEDSFIFEHGALNEEHGGCGIYHAHIHVIPNAAKVEPTDVFDFTETRFKKDIESALLSIVDSQPYVLAGDYREGFYVSTLEHALPSQTLRRNTAQVLGKKQWNWREAKREDSMIQLLKANAG